MALPTTTPSLTLLLSYNPPHMAHSISQLYSPHFLLLSSTFPIQLLPLGLKKKSRFHIVLSLPNPHQTQCHPPWPNQFLLGCQLRVFLSTEAVCCFACGELGHSCSSKKSQQPPDENQTEKPFEPPNAGQTLARRRSRRGRVMSGQATQGLSPGDEGPHSKRRLWAHW